MGVTKSEAVIWATDLDSNNSTALEELGIERTEYSVTYGRRKYFYSQNADAAVTISQYDAVGWNIASYKKAVTADATDTAVNLPAGAALYTINPSYYGWFLKEGYAPVLNQNGGGDIAKGDALILSSTDGRVDAISSGGALTQAVIGFAPAADAGTFTCVAYVNC